jgi:class 3 adenylate cyclase
LSDLEITPVYLLLADISGYTRFVTLHQASVLHAEEIVTQLMDAVLEAATNPLVLNKLEGDAAFFYAPAGDDAGEVAAGLVQQVSGMMAAFRRRQGELVQEGEGGCFCDACCNLGALKLKFILHSGEAILKRVRQWKELAGRDVILAHRLLKNRLVAREYILMTENFARVSGGLPDWTSASYTDDFEGIGQVKTLVFYPEPPSPDIPFTQQRFVRPAGIFAGLKLFGRPLWRRFAGKRLTFHNLPAKA